MQIKDFKDIATTFAVPGSELLFEKTKLDPSANDDLIEANITAVSGDIYVDEGGGPQPASKWIINRRQLSRRRHGRRYPGASPSASAGMAAASAGVPSVQLQAGIFISITSLCSAVGARCALDVEEPEVQTNDEDSDHGTRRQVDTTGPRSIGWSLCARTRKMFADCYGAAGMLTVERAKHFAPTLYQLAFLLTGDRRWSFDVSREALDSHNDANTVFSSWMLAWSRKVVIAKALAVIRDDLASSARRTAFRRAEQVAVPSRDFVLDPDATRIQTDKALLAIDVFPRCALVLTLFEKLSVGDAAVLLGEDQDLVNKAQIIGLRDLTFNLARMKG